MFTPRLTVVILPVWLSLWSISGARADGSPTMVLQTGHSGLVSHLAFNEARTLLATVGSDSQLILWDVLSGLQFGRIRLPDTGNATATAFAESDGLVVAAGAFGVYAFDVQSGHQRWKHPGPAFSAAARTGTEHLIVATGQRSQLNVIDLHSGTTVKTFAADAANPLAMALSPDGGQVAVGDFDRVATLGTETGYRNGRQRRRVVVYDVSSGRAKYELRSASDWISALTFSSDGSLLAVGSYERTGSSANNFTRVAVEVFDTRTRTRRFKIDLPVQLSTVGTLAFDGNVLGIGLAGNDSDRMGGALLLANPSGQLSRIESPIGSIWALASGGRGLWAGVNGSRAIQMWDAAVGVPTQLLLPQGQPVTKVAFDPADSSRVLVSAEGAQTQLFDLRLGVTVTLGVGEAIVAGDLVAGRTRALKANQLRVTGSRPPEAHTVYRVEDFKAREVLTTTRDSYDQSPGRISIDPTGTFFAESVERYRKESEIRVWELNSRRLLFTVKRAAQTRTLDFLAGAMIVEDSTGLGIWSVPTGRVLLEVGEGAEWAETYVDRVTSSVQRIIRPADSDRAAHRSLHVRVVDGSASAQRAVGPPETILQVGPTAIPFVPDGAFGHQLVVHDRRTGKRVLLDYIVQNNDGVTYRLSPSGYEATADGADFTGDSDLLNLPVTRSSGVSPDSRHYVEITHSGEIFVWSVGSGRFEARLPGNGYPITSWMFSADGTHLLTGTQAGDATIWDLHTRKRLGSVVSLSSGDWIVLDAQQKYFFGSRQAEVKMAYRVDDRAVPFEQFDLLFNRPDVVLRSIGAASLARLTAAEKAYQARRLATLGSSAATPDEAILPELAVHNSAGVSTEQSSVELSLELLRGTGPARVNAMNNDSPVVGVDGTSVSGPKAPVTVRVPLAVGVNELSFSVTDSAGTESLRTVMRLMRLGSVKPRTFVVVAAVSKYGQGRPNLPNAAPDAQAVAATFRGLKNFHGPEPLTLLDSEVGSDLSQRVAEFIQDATVDDRLVVYVAGHGTNSGADGYRFVLPGSAGNVSSFIHYDAFERLLSRAAPLRKILFLDTCFAGSASSTLDPANTDDQEWRHYDLLDDLVSLRRSSGAIVVAASTEAVLDSSIANAMKRGPFAQALIEALTEPEADTNLDGAVTTSELKAFVSMRVPALSQGLMTPVIRNDNLRNDFAVR